MNKRCICGKEFETRDKRQLYCSPRCGDRALRQRNPEKYRENAKKRRSPDYKSDPSQPRYRPLEERFWEKVQKTETCWLWTASHRVYKLHYGTIGINGKTYDAHRVSYEMAYGPIPDGLNVLHKCDNPKCVRPDHLFLGTQKDNAQDMVRKGRKRGGIDTHNQSGEKNKQAKLTVEDVRAIRLRYANGDVYMEQLASEYGISIGHVSVIISRKVWRHIA